MTTVSAVARLIPKPPALVDSRNANAWELGAETYEDEEVAQNIPFYISEILM